MANTKIYSSMSNDLVVTKTSKHDQNKDVSKANIDKAIIIKGGANVTNPVTMNRGIKWVETEVSESDLATLKEHPGFNRRVKRGFITIGKPPVNPKKDKSAQITESEMKSKTKAKPATGPVEE